jgi:hypothetical protein
LSFHPGPPAKSGSIADYIQEIPWDPSGKLVAFLMGSPIPKIYLVNADGTETKAVEFHNLLDSRSTEFFNHCDNADYMGVKFLERLCRNPIFGVNITPDPLNWELP